MRLDTQNVACSQKLRKDACIIGCNDDFRLSTGFITMWRNIRLVSTSDCSLVGML